MKNNRLNLILLLAIILVQTKQTRAQARMILSGGAVVKLNGGSSAAPLYTIVNNSQTNAVSATDGAHILTEGQYNIFQWNIADGTGAYIVPLGAPNGDTIPVILDISTPGSTGGAMQFSSYGTLNSENLPLPDGVNSIDHVEDPNFILPNDGAKVYDRFWFITPVDYVTKPEGNMTLYYSIFSKTGDLFPGTPMSAQSHNGMEWNPMQLGFDNLFNNISGIPFSDANFSSTWTLVESFYPLPITLTEFDARWGDENQSFVELSWETASEFNNDFFEVERSRDGESWHSIAQVDGAGTSSISNSYQTKDMNPLNGVSYYRLRQVDFDGIESYSQIVVLQRSQNQLFVSLSPNPASNQVALSFFGLDHGTTKDYIQISITDNAGREIYSNIISPNSEEGIIINSTGFKSGLYHVKIQIGSQIHSKKLIIQK